MQASHVRHCHTSNRSDHLCRSFRSLHSSQRKCSSAAARRSRPADTQTACCQGRQASTATVQQTKQRLASLAGKKYGHNLSTQQKQDVEKVIKELEDMAPDRNKQPDLTGSNWKLLYTTSGGSSGGRVGPLVGLVDQVCSRILFVVMLSPAVRFSWSLKLLMTNPESCFRSFLKTNLASTSIS